MSDCVFCKIAGGEIPSNRVYEDDQVLAFHDIQPQAPVHILVVPRRHVANVMDLAPADGDLLQRLFAAVQAVVREQGLLESGFRLVTNNGPDAGQVVHHLHFHILGGTRLRRMG